MAIRIAGAAGAAETADDGDEESSEEFEARVYDALMRVARSSSERVRSALGSCVLLGTRYEGAPDIVRETIRKFIESAEL
jgi:hypothetical protein